MCAKEVRSLNFISRSPNTERREIMTQILVQFPSDDVLGMNAKKNVDNSNVNGPFVLAHD